MRLRSLLPWLALAVVLVLSVSGYLLWRGSASSSVAATGEWVMEGYNPARTRAVDSSLPVPLTKQREVRVLEDNGEGSPVAIVRNIALVEADGQLRAVDLDSGKERWSFPVTGTYISPASDGERVYVKVERNNKGQVFALSLEDGQQKWAFAPKRLSSAETDYWGGHLTSPVIQNSLVYIGAGKELYALNAETGEVEWEYATEDYVLSSASVADGNVFISDAKFVYAVDARTGKQVWRKPAAFAVYFAPIVADGKVFVSDGDRIVALSTNNGNRVWELPFTNQSAIPGAAQNNRLFVTSGVALHALDMDTGRKLWSYAQPNYVSLPAVAGERVFVLTGSTGQIKLTALDASSGKAIWNQKVPNLVGASPVIAGNTLYLRTTDGRVIAFSN